ncbi:hypothetical protein CV012_17015 [Klebsiella pneumoniae]|nr:hypothetical protein BB750_28710 [Klebsiella pneumoniae]OCU22914.1 hypothetical protein A6D87_18450 [Klebsiella quasipneumoniae]PAQ19469.1 hypothetical protein B7979_12805 [Escherichia coli]PXL49811.1 hypothetical protein DMS35_25890 [Klebsiella variicola]RNZ47051.1 hypothetical protein C5X79_028600 [Klebsiella pneumoniae subsp. pneumoniae]
MISTPFYKIGYLNPQTIPDILQIKHPAVCSQSAILSLIRFLMLAGVKNLLFVIGSKDSLDTHEVHR